MDMRKRGQGFTIIEVTMFFAVTGMLMLGVLGSASVGINTQRYNDAVNTFGADIQQEFIKASNVVNSQRDGSACGTESPRGTSTSCIILGRLLTIKSDGTTISSNLVGTENTNALNDEGKSELQVIQAYAPQIDTGLQETGAMNWETKIERNDTSSDTSVLIVRSPRSGNLYSYVIRSLVESDDSLRNSIRELIYASTPPNSVDQYLCVDRSGWVATSTRAIKLAPFVSGPNGVSIVDAEADQCR